MSQQLTGTASPRSAMRGSSMRTSHREANKKGMMAKGSSSLAGRAFDEFGGGDTFLTERPSTAASDDTAFAGLSARKSLAPATDGSIGTLPPLARPDSVNSARSERERRKKAVEAMLALSAEDYVELAFEAKSFSLFDFCDDTADGPVQKALKAAKEFDERQVKYSGAVRKHIVELEVRPDDLIQQFGYNTRMLDLRRNRFFVPEKLAGVEAVAKRAPRRKRRPVWKLETSCWAERAKTGNSNDFFETTDALRRMFEVDWGVAKRAHELSWLIVRTGNDPATWRELDRAKVGGFGEVQEVADAIWQHHKLIYGAYDYYSCLYSESENAAGEPDIFNITFAAFMNFCEHNKMVSKKVSSGEMETIWAVVNAKDKALTAAEDKNNKGNTLNRQEFLQCIVRCAIAVYIKKGGSGDVSDAVNQLCLNNLLSNMQKKCPGALQSSNAFRTRFCYIESVSVVLEQNMASLKALYENYAEVSQQMNDTLRDDDLMSIGEWMAFINHMGLVESRQLSTQQAKSIFLWSRIRSVGSNSDKEEIKLRHLTFEDFLEALVRMSTMLAFPTMIEIEDVGAANAGEFLLAMQQDNPKAYIDFLDTHRPKHNDPDGSDFDPEGTGLRALFQPIHLLIKHLVSLLIHTVEHNTSALRDETQADGAIQADEAAKFIKRRSTGKDLTLGARKGMLDNTDWAMAQDRAFFTAAAIKIQLASRAKKAKRAVEARRKRIEETKEETVREEAAGGEHQEAKANMNEQVDGILASPRL
jgi:hypothetical protein